MTDPHTPPIRVALLGLGYFSQFHIDGWTRAPDAALIGLCDRDGAKAAAAASALSSAAVSVGAFDDAAEMIETLDPDLIDIAAPPTAHAAIIEAALTAPRQEPNPRPRAILCQKPFCRDLAEAAAIAAKASAAGAVLAVHENFRFQPWHRAARAMIESGALGQIHQASFRLRPGDGQGPEAYRARQPFFREMPRFLLHETAIHFIDVFRFLLGEIASVYADLRQLNPAIAGEDAGMLVFEHASGARSLFDGNRLLDHAAADRRRTMGEMLVEGEGGCLRLDGDGRLFLRRFGETAETAVDVPLSDRGFGGDCVFALQRHMLDHLTAGAPLENAAEAYLANLRVEAAAYRSAEIGAKVAID